MNRLTDNDKNWGPFTLAPWKGTISFLWKTYDEDDEVKHNVIRLIAFGWALQVRIPAIIQPWREKKIARTWDEETVKRMERDWYYVIYPREFGISLSNMGNGYDFLQIHYGAQTHDSQTDKTWCKHLPWKQWDCVRHSVYNPDGTHYATEEKGNFHKWYETKLGFEDYDGEMIVATCRIEEMEWHRGQGWFKWLKYFWPAKIRRSLDLKFSAEVGPEKGSWKGGTIGHGIEMLKDENPEQAFRRYCQKEQSRKGRKFNLRFIGVAQQPQNT